MEFIIGLESIKAFYLSCPLAGIVSFQHRAMDAECGTRLVNDLPFLISTPDGSAASGNQFTYISGRVSSRGERGHSP